MKNDSLYIQDDENLIKVHPDVLLSLADYVDEVDGQYVFNIDRESSSIPKME